MKINICYASDENYVMPLSVSLYSFLEHHQEIEQIFIHILGNKITHDSQEKIKEIALEFNRELTFYDLSEKLESIYLQNNIPNTIAITSYSRLFIDEFLPAKLEGTLLYVDCDTLFLSSIKEILSYPQEKKIEEKYAESSIFLLSSRYEGFGMVFIEAMSFGIPCVSFVCNYGPSDIIRNNEEGFLVTNGNEKELAEKLQLLMKNETLRLQMGKKARENVQRFLPENVVKQWDELFKRLE